MTPDANLPPDPKPVQSILCVCLGNICRSPTAQAVLETLMPEARVDSAGTGDWHIGKPPHGPAIAAARARGYDLTRQRARQVRPADFHEFDLILAMDSDNLRDLKGLRPADATARLALFMEAADQKGPDVPDPYFSGNYEVALNLIEIGARGWLDQLHIASAVSPKER